jgi:hypothetical protein
MPAARTLRRLGSGPDAAKSAEQQPQLENNDLVRIIKRLPEVALLTGASFAKLARLEADGQGMRCP